MTDSVVLSSKYQAEIHQFVADFTGQLQPGESFVAGNVSVSVFLDTGVDPNASAILVTPFTLIGNVVSQGLQQGVPGCIYVVVIHVVTNLSRGLTLTARQAVLPNNYPATGAFIPYYFTSQPYPYLDADTLHWSGSVQSCLVNLTFRDYDLGDTIHWIGSVPTALVTSGLYPYVLPETLHWTGSVVSSSVMTTLILYTYPETTHWTGAVVSSTVTTILISYSYPETLHWTGSVQSCVVT
jgi:hypothetical protein